ncbi:MAG: phage holin family protein [Actinobacteria bacterium]|nr:phage holin family protein [Actinomycetota bacterium]
MTTTNLGENARVDPPDGRPANGTGAANEPSPTSDGTEKSLSELAGDLTRQMTALVHDEIELAKTEMSEKGKRVGLGTGMLGAAGVLALFALGCLTACAVAAVALVTSVWLAALVVGAAYLVVAGLLALTARAQLARATPPVPEEAMESAKEDVAWLKTQMRSAKR